VCGSATGRKLAWDFLKTNWEKVNKMYEGGFLLGRLIKLVTEDFADTAMIPEIKVGSQPFF